MKGIRFYLEYPNSKEKRKGTRKELGNHSGNVTAVCGDIYYNGREFLYEAFTGLFEESNSDVCFSSVSPEFIFEKCKRISEQQAREIHPKMFERICD